jgi:hypothetical protein
MHPKLLAVIGLGAGAAALGLAGELGRAGRALAAAPVSREKVAFSTSLENVPGSRLTAVVVGYGPGERSPAHHHAGSVYAYVLTGSIRSENSATGPARSIAPGKVSSNRLEAFIGLARTRVQRTPRRCLPYLSPLKAAS